MSGKISYNSEIALRSKRVKFEPAVTTDTLKAGYVVCYNNDRTTDLRGTTVAAGTTNPARFLQVEKPKTANLKFVAGVVAPSGEGAVNGDWVDIYELNGADIPVWTDQSCTNGTTLLAVTDGSYLLTAVGSANITLGLAKDTIDRSETNGFVLMSSKVRAAGDATDYATLSAVVSTNSALLSTISNLAAVITTDELSTLLSNAISTEISGNTSLATMVDSDISDLTASINAMVDSAISDLKASSQSELASQVKILSDATSALKESALSDIASVATALNSAISDVVATAVAETASLATMVDSAVSDLTTRIDSVEVHMLSVTSDMTASINTMVDSMHSDMTASINAQIDSAVSDLNATIDSAISDVVATAVAETASLAAALDSAISDVNAELDLVSDMASSNSAAISNLDNDDVSVLASVAFTTLTSLHIGYTKITAADGTQYSVVGFVKST